MKAIHAGIIGFGTVGTGVVKLLRKNREVIKQQLGVPLNLKRIADIDLKRDRGVKLPPGLLTKNTADVINDPDISIIVELIGGNKTAKSVILKSLKSGKHVVTANKALLAEDGERIFAEARKNDLELGFEASVGAGIPIIRAIKDGLAGDRIQAVQGIINGTSNYILSKMTHEGGQFEDVLKSAQEKGYAEANPSYDVKGIDSAHKLAILASLAFGTRVSLKDIYVEGISRVTPLDIQLAGELGYRIKLLAIAQIEQGRLEMRVHPTMLPKQNLLTTVNGVLNAIMVEGEAVGPLVLHGNGAGMMSAAAGVLSDMVEVAKNILKGCQSRNVLPAAARPDLKNLSLMPMSEVRCRYYMRFSAIDKPGVLSKISGILGKNNISISSVIQRGRKVRGGVPIVLLTHEAREKDVQRSIQQADRLAMTVNPTMLIRISE